MRVLIVGSGGREHALAWKIKQSTLVDKVYCAPGNGGISSIAECVDIKPDDITGLIGFATRNKIDLTVVGPEAPLALGIVDRFCVNGLRVFGPSKEAAKIEASKVFMKQLMKKYGIPTADFEVFEDSARAKKYIGGLKGGFVVKADGLAAGKGVVVCSSKEQGISAVESIMERKDFRTAGNRIIIEECLEGEEVSMLVITDGKDCIPLASAQDHKRIFDGDNGPNTGGMGAYSPAPVATPELTDSVMNDIIKPTIAAMGKENARYTGVLYAGIMVTAAGPKVLEFNCRFGDPETQAILPRLKSDLIELIEASIDDEIDIAKPDWDERPCVSVVLSSGGYPGEYETGFEIEGLDALEKARDVYVFHAGTRLADGKTVTAGGRVLNVTALGSDIRDAIDRCYNAVNLIEFEGMHFRRDIGHRALKR
ncbi:MAG TPA: phosphoribosylamine--glycine ligase [Candidatus Omnitrophota bacterium]|nr:phosphoribosylamine--glycine ligase [Candidatus Omnitrophota bacterium]HOX09132.1 phosphoribosylamine--glycine ligase [Candidatus Omnitrophota bacterium]HPN66357.1 phosphoribosylamine--glycine ligase [Candidatus Omnitrophota bacterium]